MANVDNKVKNEILDLNLFDGNATTHINADGSITGENIGSTLRDMIAIPNWSIRDFAIERWKFKTQSSAESTLSPYGEPGMFFYKVLFNFNTSYGLLGGLINEMNGKPVKDINTAQIELAKVSDASGSQLSSYWDEAANSAKKYGATISDVISSTADWSRLGMIIAPLYCEV